MDVFQLYKPFRNRLRMLACDDALRVIWAYSQYLQLPDFQIPADIEVHREFYKLRPAQKWISEWELELLAKEVLLNAGTSATRGRTLRSWKSMAEVTNQLKELENNIYKAHGSNTNIRIELVRIAHRQFVWQTNPPNSTSTIRYFRIFDQPDIDRICLERLGLTVRDTYLCGIGLLGCFLSQPSVRFPITSQIESITGEKIDSFINFTCRPIEALKTTLAAEQQYNDKFPYAYSSLRASPLIRMRFGGIDSIVCPLPTLLFWRLTGGLYYELLNDPAFPELFGKSFQRYVGEVIARACSSGKIKLLAEQEYLDRKNRKDSVDWIVSDDETAIFLECKSKRLSWNAKTALEDVRALEADIGYMAQAVVQVYKTVRDYQAGRYQHFAYSSTRKIYPVVVTLENWHMFAPAMGERLNMAVVEKLKAENLPEEVLKQMPYSVWAVDELEVSMQIIDFVGLRDFLDCKINDPEMTQWEWMPYITHRYRDHLPPRRLFGEEYHQIFAGVTVGDMKM